MRLVRCKHEATGRIFVGAMGKEAGESWEQSSWIVDLSSVRAANDVTSMREFLAAGDAVMERAKKFVEMAPGNVRYRKSECKILGPIGMHDASKVICVGMNYREHCIEQDFPIPTEPVIFSKFPSSLAGTHDDIEYDSRWTDSMDFEVELAVVIGKECKNVDAKSAEEYIAGYTVAHDVSARDWQLKKNGGQWLLGKCQDGYAPLGPSIVTPDEMATLGGMDR